MDPSGTVPVHALSVEEALARFEGDRGGLAETTAAERLRRFGPNALEAGRPASAWRILLDQFRSVVVLLLLAAAAVSLALEEVADAAAIGGVLAINTLIGFATEIRARRAMEALLGFEVPRAVVVRGGRARELDSRELVPGDVVQVEAGGSVPADARILEATDLRAEEASLTGESLPIDKAASPVAADTPLPDRSDMLYKGTTVVAGTGLALVVATGMQTELGRIGRMVSAIPEERTPLERKLDALGRRLVVLALFAGSLVAVVGAFRGLPPGLLLQTGIALAVAAVPEGLPAVVTIALAVGVHRMARRRALVRRLASVETLGSVTVVCTDKTGTLTAGEPTVTVIASGDREIAVTGAGYEPVGEFREGARCLADPLDPLLEAALRIATLANRAGLTRAPEGWTVQGDPTEAALLVAGRKARILREELLARHPQVGEVPFSSERKLMATFHCEGDGGRLIACVKGAPGRVLERCARYLTIAGEPDLADDLRRRLEEQNQRLAGRGLRVLALARGAAARPDEGALRDLTFVAFVAMTDPIADGVSDTIEAFHDAGVRTVMITGDQRMTAESIARDLGMLRGDRTVLEGRALAQLDEAGLAASVERAAAFSRVSPEDKLRIVDAYRARGEIVAMLGDGVNDAAALRRADVGVAMGRRGTDVAKEAADVVLQDDRFATIGAAVEEGRVVFDNIRKFALYLFSCNLAEVFVLVAGSAAGLALPLQPLQILWLNLVTDTFPALALALEPAEPGIMRRPPQDPAKGIFSSSFLAHVLGFAVLLTAVTLAAFAVGGSGEEGGSLRAVTMSFTTLALAQAFHLGNARSGSRVLAPRQAFANPYALGAVALVLVLQVVALHVPGLASVLRVEPLSARDWAIVLALAGLPAVVGQALKPAPRESGAPKFGNPGLGRFPNLGKARRPR
jgi:P-type Ca2+ transporter type 2C